jgi:hypothetical protein
MKIKIKTWHEGEKEVTAYPVKFRGWLSNYKFAAHRTLEDKTKWRISELSIGFGLINAARTKSSAIKIARKILMKAGPQKLDEAIKLAREMAHDLAARKP